jgi:hypothetical protein
VKIAVTTVLGEPEGDLEEFLRFHRAAGVDVVVVAGGRASSGAPETLERYVGEGFVRRVEGDASQTELARIAVDELGADWLIPGSPDELWWPRGESLKDVLAIIPPRYGVVQALVRTFVGEAEPSTAGGSAFATRTVRTSLLGPDGSGGESLQVLLRPVYRAGLNMTLDAADWTLGGRRVPLRAWYPVEVFRYPAESWDRARLEVGLADGSLVIDTRLRDALAAGGTSFPVPSIVDDSSYAVECAAVGEVDLVRLDRQIRDLELRISELEARFWPRVRRILRRLARRPS